MPKSSVSPEAFKVEIIQNNRATFRLRKNIQDLSITDPITQQIQPMYQYDEVVVEMKNRSNLEQYIESNFETLWSLGIKQGNERESKKQIQRELEKLINEGQQVGLNNEVKENIHLLEEQAKVDLIQARAEKDVEEKIDAGLITADNFNLLDTVEQELTKLVLFKRYSPNQNTIPKALSSTEFFLITIMKLLDKTMDRSNLSVEENDFFENVMNSINLNDMPINNTSDWRFNYMLSVFEQVQQNRNEYFQTKQAITGSI